MAIGERQSTASRAGYHFLSQYQACRWKWYLHHIRHIVPLKTSKYLLYGQAFHGMKEYFYLNGAPLPRATLIEHGVEWLKSLRDQYEYEDQYLEDLKKMEVMAGHWWDTFAEKEFDTYDILAIEEEMLIHLPGDFTMTVRPDVVVRDKETGIVYAFETKTTSRSVGEMARSVACQQQVDAQILGMRSWLKEHEGLDDSQIGGVIPDIVYVRQSVKKAERCPAINRSAKELADSQLSFSGLFSEIGQKVQALGEGNLPPEMLFDRNGSWCAQFGCEYESVCRSRFTGAPPGFRLEE